MRILVLHGPNLTSWAARTAISTGRRRSRCECQARNPGARARHRVGDRAVNHEGVLIDTLHANIDKADGAIINPPESPTTGFPSTTRFAAMPFPSSRSPVEPAARRSGAIAR